jgi:hypothetical protein
MGGQAQKSTAYQSTKKRNSFMRSFTEKARKHTAGRYRWKITSHYKSDRMKLTPPT